MFSRFPAAAAVSRSVAVVLMVWAAVSLWTPGRPGLCRAEGGEIPAAGRVSAGSVEPPAGIPEVIAAGRDVWGEAALREPDGPSYEFFRDLLPPLKYVNTDFRFYPIMLSAPQSPRKCRFVGNGSGINLLARKEPMWFEMGRPIKFCIGEPGELFGSDATRLEGPTYAQGFLPVVSVGYRRDGIRYIQEAFAPVEADHADHGAVMVRFTVAGSGAGRVETRIEAEDPLQVAEGRVLDEEGAVVVSFGPNWQWQGTSNRLVAWLRPGESAELAVFTEPVPPPGPAIDSAIYTQRRGACLATWNDLLSRGTRLAVPEPLASDAWRSTIIGNFMIADGDRMHYSAGNRYAKLYQAECGDALTSLLLFGHQETARAMLRPIMEFYREETRFHVAGHKLQLLAYYYWITRDAQAVRANEDLWRATLDLIVSSREADTGLLPRDNYAGDISQQVYSLNSNANCWRGLRDLAAVLDDMGESEEAGRLLEEAAAFREAILAAVTHSERRDTSPPFIPVALLADEPAHDPLTDTRIGSYYNLIAPYVMGSGIFGHGDQREDWLLAYMQARGGISMGMMRTQPHQGEFNGYHGVVPLYGLRYLLTLLRRDEVEKAQVGFYGHLAQGMTRDTYIGGEGTRFLHGDPAGRVMYLPPNSTSNAAFLITLRHLLIQDWDLDQDGRPDTLRLLYAAPRRWLRDHAAITVQDAPTMFGPVSLEVQSRLSAGEVAVRFTPPPHWPDRVRLRVPLPAGWSVSGAEIDGADMPLAADASVDLSDRRGPCVVRFTVTESARETTD